MGFPHNRWLDFSSVMYCRWHPPCQLGIFLSILFMQCKPAVVDAHRIDGCLNRLVRVLPMVFPRLISQGENEYESAERTRLRKQAMRQRNGGSVGASASLAERLLQGWAMLSTACPTAGCHNPLMRDRTGTILCVSCGEATAAPGKSPAPGESPAPVERKGGSMDDEKEDRGMVDDSTAKRIYARHRLNERGDYVPADSTAVAIAKSVSETSTLDRARITTQTLDTLYRALEASQQRLDSCTRAAPVDVHESARQADLIAKLAHAAKALNDLLT